MARSAVRTTTAARLASVVVSFLLVSGAVLHASATALTSAVDDDGGAVPELLVNGVDDLFAGGPLGPGATRTACVTVEYLGSSTARVALTPTVRDGGIAEDLRVTVEGTGRTCAAGDAGEIFAGSVAELGRRADGVGAWTADVGDRRAYRITVTADDDLAAGTVDVDLDWTATV